jgi:predicted secreted protein
MFALLALVSVLHLTAKDNHKSFTVKPQTPIVVTLVANPSTGYQWKYKPSKGGGKVIKLISDRYIPPKKGSPPGAAGKEIWHLRAVGAGKMNMQFFDVPPGMSKKGRPKVTIAIHVS